MNVATAYLIFTYAGDTLWGRVVARVTGRRLPDKSDCFSHVAIGFGYRDTGYRDAGTQTVGMLRQPYSLHPFTPSSLSYFENLLTRGFRGPHPLSHMADWVSRDRRRTWNIRSLPLTPSQAQAVHDACIAWAGVVRRGYNAAQLAAIWASIRFGRPVPRTPTRGICSEDVARLLFPILDLREPGKSFDHADPNSVYRRYLQLSSPVAAVSDRRSPLQPSPLQPSSLPEDPLHG
jgi:hypothetical protein